MSSIKKHIDFSVLISVYEREHPSFLRMALESLLNQTLAPSEVVLIKDGLLTPELNDVITDFEKKFPSVKVSANESNMGLSASLARGLQLCSFEYVARMDSDDICMENRFETLINFVEQNSDVDVVGSWATKIDNNGKEIGVLKTPVENEKIYNLIWTCPFIHPSVMFKKSRIIEAGSYSINSGPRQDDYDLWFRCAVKKFHFTNLPQQLILYRFNDDTVAKNSVKVGWARFKVGLKGCITLKMPFKAFIGVSVPLIRSLLPFPLNVWFYKAAERFNPRTQ